jgi:ribosomal protein S21
MSLFPSTFLRRTFASTSKAAEPYRDHPMRIEQNPFTRPDFPKPPKPSARYTDAYGENEYAGSSRSSASAEATEQVDPHDWWKTRAHVHDPSRQLQVVSKLHGRSLPVRRGADFNSAFRQIKRLMNETGVKKQMRLGEYYEKPSEKRVRLSSERWRTKFAAMVSPIRVAYG